MALGDDLPVGRARAHGAPAVGVVHVGHDALAGEIDARAHLLAAAEEMAEIDGAVGGAAMIGGEIDGLDVGRALGDVVDEAAAEATPLSTPARPLQEFDALLVFERHILLAGDGHAVDLEAGGEIEGKAANLVVAVVADGHVIVADRGIVLDHVREQARDLVVEQIARDDGGRERRVLERRAVERAHRDGFGKIVVFDFAVDDDGGGDGRGLLRGWRRGCELLRSWCGLLLRLVGGAAKRSRQNGEDQATPSWRQTQDGWIGDHERNENVAAEQCIDSLCFDLPETKELALRWRRIAARIEKASHAGIIRIGFEGISQPHNSRGAPLFQSFD